MRSQYRHNYRTKSEIKIWSFREKRNLSHTRKKRSPPSALYNTEMKWSIYFAYMYFGAHLRANAMWMKALPRMFCRFIGLLVQFSLPSRQCPTHAYDMTSNSLQAGHVNTLAWSSRSPDLSPIEHL